MVALPGNRIPIVSPGDLVELRPERVLLFVPDLLPEVRRALPAIESNGGRWVVLDPMQREVEPALAAWSELSPQLETYEDFSI
jgi:C-methyltransferase C-terminal domain